MDQHCPGSTADGCRCPIHHPGLLAFSRDPDALDRALTPLRTKTVLRIVTLPLADQPGCDGTFTCPCEACEGDRQEASARARRPIRQPWEVAA